MPKWWTAPLVKGQSKAESNYLYTTKTHYRKDMLVCTITTCTFSSTYKYPILLRPAQQRTLCDNELLHFQDGWKMFCVLLLSSSLPLSTQLHLEGPPTCHHRPGCNVGSVWYQVLGINQQVEGMKAKWGSGKMSSPSSSILQSYLVKANTGQYIPSCHWKRGSGALAWHANIVTCTNDDA